MASTTRFSVGLTGGIGSGKTTVAELFAGLGAAVIDTDRIAHQLTSDGGTAIEPIRQAFGTDFITANGAMDRTRMREAVFSDPASKKKLEAILHPLIRSETERAAAETQGVYPLFVVPLLVESGTWKQRVSRVLVVDCDEEVQLRRVMQRNALSAEQVRAIMTTQAPRATRLAQADDVIVNDGDPAALTVQVERLHAAYVALAQADER